MVETVPQTMDKSVEPGEETTEGGRRVRKATVKQLKKMLKKAGLKTTGKRAALTRRAKKAHLKMKGGEVAVGPSTQAGGAALAPAPVGQAGGRRRSRRSRGFKLF
jgi:hypothetical protein